MDIHPIKPGRLHPDFGGNGAHIGAGRINALFHHIAQRPSGFHPAFARQAQGFDMQQIAAHAGIGQTRDNPHLMIVFRQSVAIFLNAEVIIQIFNRNIDALHLFLDDLGDSFTGQFANLTLQIPHTRLPGIGADHLLQRFRLQREFRGL